MRELLQITFEGRIYELSFTAFFNHNVPDHFTFFNNELELRKFAPAQFDITYCQGQYPNWKFPPSYGDKFDTLRAEIIRSLLDKYKERYII